MPKLLLVRSEHAEYKEDSSIVIVPDGYNSEIALNQTIIPFPEPFVVGEFDIVSNDSLSLRLLPEYISYTEND